MRTAGLVRCPSWVNRVVLTVRRSLPVYPDTQTFSESVGMSQTCPEAELNAGALTSINQARSANQYVWRDRQAEASRCPHVDHQLRAMKGLDG
jgi:hypothetical protein